uniref:Uncharacterized protein n=1 Tax=Acrobeloides nanus TaxID=290746 RepID=A0A914C8Q6_9BILA
MATKFFLRNINLVGSSRAYATASVKPTHQNTDILAQAFVKQIRAVAEKQKAAGGSLLSTSYEHQKELEDKISRLISKYEIKDISEVGKVSVNLEVPEVQNSMEVFAEHYQSQEQLNFAYFDALLSDEKNKWYFEKMDWELLDAYDDMSQAEMQEFHERMLASEKFVDTDFIEKLRALDLAQKQDTSGDFEKNLEWVQKKHELLKEYIKLYEQNAGHKWTRDILAHIAQLDPNHSDCKEAPEDVYYDVMKNEKVIDKEEPDPQQTKYKHRLIFNGREFSETMYPKYD